MQMTLCANGIWSRNVTQTLYLAQALLPEGFADDVTLTIADGVITTVEKGAAPSAGAETVAGLTLPGLPNLHSHAFQRGMAGLSERRGASEDSFWTWREVMYRFLDRLDPDDVQAIAAQAFVEMLEGGFTALAEFHYLHHDKDGRAYADIAEMAGAIASAAEETGLGLTLLPVLYRFGNFGGAPSVQGQRRFVNDRDAYLRLIEASEIKLRSLSDARLGLAPHSLRAVALDDLDWLAGLRPDGPLHIHVAEQMREVEDSLKITGRRPVELLMQHTALDQRWCLIHATHLTPDERDGIARSGAIAGLCPITESSLGDGIFDGVRYRAAGGPSESAAIPTSRSMPAPNCASSNIRSACAIAAGPSSLTPADRLERHSGRRLCAGGAQACGRAIGRIAIGCRADLVTLDLDHPALVGRAGELALDSAIFAANALPLREVRVGGKTLVRDGRHHARERVRARFAQVMRKLLD
jgi:formimidoylglutamate deiminase